ncbi:hypothetical protein TSUD_292580 [Trifolium subterraneum]|uniref:Uncharacterized protein n=1 Tax=Trifolium subterraneum TaxID=3900 RepID=A0A2Z6N485_TRISU|nr:hypothetical protein TSUD_292580 [Trifolium subterraneum]
MWVDGQGYEKCVMSLLFSLSDSLFSVSLQLLLLFFSSTNLSPMFFNLLEVAKSNVGTAFVELGFSDNTATVVASAAADVTSAMFAQLVWTPIDVVSQRLTNYRNGLDAFRKILYADGPIIWGNYGSCMCKSDNLDDGCVGFRPDSKAMMGVQCLSDVVAIVGFLQL